MSVVVDTVSFGSLSNFWMKIRDKCLS